jgi:hypothetical protein
MSALRQVSTADTFDVPPISFRHLSSFVAVAVRQHESRHCDKLASGVGG